MPREIPFIVKNKKRWHNIKDIDDLIINLKNVDINLIIHNYIDNSKLYNYLLNLDYLLVPSANESFHKSSLESLMAGCQPLFYGEFVTKLNARLISQLFYNN